MTLLKRAIGPVIAGFLLLIFWSPNAWAQTDEIQVYDAQIAEPGVLNLMVHNNFTPEGLKTSRFESPIHKPFVVDPCRAENGRQRDRCAHRFMDWPGL